MNLITNIDVQNKFDGYPADIREKLLFIRELIFSVAASIPKVGELEETLKWGEPSYLTTESGSGSTIRIDWKKNKPNQYAIYFNCKTNLVYTFKELYGSLFTYGGFRSIIFQRDEILPAEELSDCISIALTYHLNKHRRLP